MINFSDMRRCKLLDLVVLLFILATTYGRDLRNEDQCPLSGTCVPACPPIDPEFSVFFPHPNDCHWYFQCSNGEAYCKKCPADLHWNVELDTCDWPYRAGCNESSGPSTSAPVTPTPTVPAGPTDGVIECPPGKVPDNCPFPDGVNSTFFPHPNDCHWFFHCSNGVAYCKECPADLHWNVELETCDYAYRAGCKAEVSTVNLSADE